MVYIGTKSKSGPEGLSRNFLALPVTSPGFGASDNNWPCESGLLIYTLSGPGQNQAICSEV